MNDSQRAEKIALAKRKLKEFENRRRGAGSPLSVGQPTDGRCSSLSNGSVHSIERIEADKEPFMMVNATGADSLHIERQTNASSVSSMNSSVVISNGTQDDHISPSVISNTFSSAIETRLQQERDAAVASYEQVKAQMAQLHEHYTQLHAAYSQLSGSGVHSDMENQILQLQSAVSVLVEEKTALQSELRASKDNNDHLVAELDQVRHAQPTVTDTRELQKLRHQLEQANKLTERQTAELEMQRRQSAETQAHMLSVQNEKSEAQLRVKVLLKERDCLHDALNTTKKELAMKLLHLKQLSHHQGGAGSDAPNQEQQIQTLNARISELTAESATLKSERDAILRESSTTRKQFEDYSAELATKNNELRSTFETSEAQRVFAENKVQELEMQISYLAKANEQTAEDKVEEAPVISVAETELAKKLAAVEAARSEMQKSFQSSLEEAHNQIQEKNGELSVLKEEFMSLSIRHRQLEERLNAGKASESEMLSMSEQLQSEKATVSRAVAQNKELKEQLLELEDRLVELTNSKMQSELDKQAAEHQVKLLTEQLTKEAGSKSEEREDTPEEVHQHDNLDTALDASDMEALAMHGEREQELEQKLQQAMQELADVRQELRRSHSRNEQMNQIMMNNAEDENQNSIHVELGQALERINILAAETDQLREQLRAAHERETDLHSQLSAAVSKAAEDAPVVEPVAEHVTEPVVAPVSEAPAIPDVIQEDLIEEAEEAEEEEGQKATAVPSTFSEMERWARSELEKKFTEAMTRIAEMEDKMSRLEHLNMQLQFENDTIGDHVILYHQQRKLIQDKLRAKDEQMAAVEADRRRVLDRCQELQHALKEMITNKELAATSVPGSSPIARKVYRSYSHSTVDELSGDEDVVVSSDEANDAPVYTDPRESEEGRTSPAAQATGVAMQRIMNLLDEINTPMTPAFDELHCSQCIGELKSM